MQAINNDSNIRKSQQIYRYIRKNGPVSKQDLVIGLKLSLPTITQYLQYLEELRLIDTSEKIQNTGGRNATAYNYVKNARIAIGVYLTAGHMSVVAVDLSGEVIKKERIRVKFDLGDDNYLKLLGNAVEKVKSEVKASAEDLLGVGLAVQSLVSEDGERITYGKTMNFAKTERVDIAKYIPYKNRLLHDSETAGYAEAWIDNSLENAFYLSLSNSVGGAVIVHNGIYVGDSHKAGEIGHTLAVRKNGEQCYCGRYGCFDTVCRATKLHEYTDGNLEEFFIKLENNDEIAKEKWEIYLNELAIGIHNIRMLFDDTIIIGGYVGAYIEDYMIDLIEKVDQRNPFEESAAEYLRPCKYKVEATAAGAALYYIDEFFNRI